MLRVARCRLFVGSLRPLSGNFDYYLQTAAVLAIRRENPTAVQCHNAAADRKTQTAAPVINAWWAEAYEALKNP